MRHRLGWLSFALQLLAVFVRAGASHAADGFPVCTASGDQHSASIVSDAAGGAILIWLDARDGRKDVYAQRIGVDGERMWTASGVAVAQMVFGSPSISVDGATGALIAWGGQNPSSVQVRRLDPSGHSLWTGVVSAPYWEIYDPAILPNGSGGALVAWYGYSPNGPPYDPFDGADVSVQRIDRSGALLMGPSGQRICPAHGDQFWPSAIPAGTGGALVTWRDVASYMLNYAQLILPDGSADWGDGLALSSFQADQSPAQGVWDGGAGGIFAWAERRYDPLGPRDIFMQHLIAAGPQWGADGVAVCTANGDQQSPAVVTDGAGGAIVAWFDPRSSDRMFAQHAQANGTFAWADGGIALCEACAVRLGPVMASDGGGGAIVAWEDGRNGQPDIYAQRVTASGTMAWGSDGIAICTSLGRQTEPRIVADGTGGAIVAWTDARSGIDNDIYAEHVDSNGVIVSPRTAGVASPVHAAPIALSIAPNPMMHAAEIAWVLPAAAPVDLSVCDLTGRIVARPAIDRECHSGRSSLSWDGRDDEGRRLPAGLYLVRAKVAGESLVRRVTLLP